MLVLLSSVTRAVIEARHAGDVPERSEPGQGVLL